MPKNFVIIQCDALVRLKPMKLKKRCRIKTLILQGIWKNMPNVNENLFFGISNPYLFTKEQQMIMNFDILKKICT